MRNTLKLLTIAGAVFSGAEAGLSQVILDESYPETISIPFSEAHGLIAADFYDPQSTQYKGLVANEYYPGETALCGWVNAKNQAGGYTPFYPFSLQIENQQVKIYSDYLDPIMANLTKIVLQSNCGTKLSLTE